MNADLNFTEASEENKAVMGSACVSHAAFGVSPNALGTCSQRDVPNGDRAFAATQWLRHARETVALPFELIPETALSRRNAQLCKK